MKSLFRQTAPMLLVTLLAWPLAAYAQAHEHAHDHDHDHHGHDHDHGHDHGHGAAAHGGGGAPDMEAMMAVMEAAGAPGGNHEFMARMEGDWSYTSKVWMDPTQPPMDSSGTSKKKMILGGRYLQEKTTGSMMGMEFSGIATTSYDNVGEEWTSTWVDSMSTAMAIAKGQREGDTITMHGEYLEPMSKQMMKVRQVLHVIDDDNHTFEYFMTIPGVPEMKSMEMHYVRAGSD